MFIFCVWWRRFKIHKKSAHGPVDYFRHKKVASPTFSTDNFNYKIFLFEQLKTIDTISIHSKSTLCLGE